MVLRYDFICDLHVHLPCHFPIRGSMSFGIFYVPAVTKLLLKISFAKTYNAFSVCVSHGLSFYTVPFNNKIPYFAAIAVRVQSRFSRLGLFIMTALRP